MIHDTWDCSPRHIVIEDNFFDHDTNTVLVGTHSVYKHRIATKDMIFPRFQKLGSLLFCVQFLHLRKLCLLIVHEHSSREIQEKIRQRSMFYAHSFSYWIWEIICVWQKIPALIGKQTNRFYNFNCKQQAPTCFSHL